MVPCHNNYVEIILLVVVSHERSCRTTTIPRNIRTCLRRTRSLCIASIFNLYPMESYAIIVKCGVDVGDFVENAVSGIT